MLLPSFELLQILSRMSASFWFLAQMCVWGVLGVKKWVFRHKRTDIIMDYNLLLEGVGNVIDLLDEHVEEDEDNDEE